MRFRLGLAIGFGAGYYFGAKAGRERYEQMEQWIHKARDSDLVETATEKAKAVVDLGTERARDLIHRRREGRESSGVATEVKVQGNGATGQSGPTATP